MYFIFINYSGVSDVDCYMNSLFQHLWKCIKDSMENMHTDIRVLGVLRVLRVNKHFLSKRGITIQLFT